MLNVNHHVLGGEFSKRELMDAFLALADLYAVGGGKLRAAEITRKSLEAKYPKISDRALLAVQLVTALLNNEETQLGGDNEKGN